MSSPKKFLQEKLSLSSKLFLKEWLASGRRLFQALARESKLFARRVAGRLHLSLFLEVDLEPPLPPPIDYSLVEFPAIPNAINVRTSIVIPVFNKAGYTFQCLRSLLREIGFSETEVIIVDNGSTDETQDVLTHFAQFVRAIRNNENRGFVDACNQGAASARGKYLVFLNNDTEVLPGWLKHLIETVESDPSIGAVGSMFFYPDGKIQEAGAIVWSNGEAHHVGWRASPNDRRFNFAREVDYCSAASLLIRKDLFDQLGGFDRRFAPAYYEDVDLCFGVRSLGYKVIYQPMSRVIHYEGATAGRDVNKSFKQYQVLNREKLFDKWHEVLQRDHFEKNLKQVEAASSRDRRPVILVFDERVPSPDRDAGSARMFFILQTLAREYRVVFLPFNRPLGVAYEEALWKIGIQTGDAHEYKVLLKRNDVVATVLSRPTVAQALLQRIRRYDQHVKIVFDMVDAYFVRFQREYEVTGDAKALKESQHYRTVETRLARASDLIWCNSLEDKRMMQREAPGKPIEVITTIHEIHERGKSFAERSGLLFIGNMAHRPNADAVEFLVREILPRVQVSLPDVKLYIVGGNKAGIARFASESIIVTGYVPDIAQYLESCRVFVAPIRFGAGTKGKVGEAMSYGLPVVTTSIGAEGFGLTHGVNVMICDESPAFAESVIGLYTKDGLWETIAENSRNHVRGNFTPEVLARVISSSIRETLDGNQVAR